MGDEISKKRNVNLHGGARKMGAGQEGGTYVNDFNFESWLKYQCGVATLPTRS